MGLAVAGLEGFGTWEVPGGVGSPQCLEGRRLWAAEVTLGVTPSVAKPQFLLVRCNVQLPLGGDCEDQL